MLRIDFINKCVDASIDSGNYDPFSPDTEAIMSDPEPLYHYDDDGRLVDEDGNIVEEA